MIDLQKLVDAMNANMQAVRSDYQLTLGQMIEALKPCNPSLPVTVDGSNRMPGKAISYRGYYCDLAFKMSEEPITAGELLQECVLARGHTFEGYKGGDFVMNDDTPLWFSDYGEASSIAFIGVEDRDYAVVLTTKLIDE